jgi:hypothetical protein
MKKAIEFDDEENLAVPVNHIVAVVNSGLEAAAIAERLNKNGFSADEIGVLVLTGTADSVRGPSKPPSSYFGFPAISGIAADLDSQRFPLCRKRCRP